MVFQEETYTFNGRDIVLRSVEATPQNADMLLSFLKQVTGETPFLMCDPNEVTSTMEEEIDFIKRHNEGERQMLLCAYVDGKHAGNCSFKGKTRSRREIHRVGIGIALRQEYTGFGLGRLMLQALLRVIQEKGYEQAELKVVGGNERALHLYQSLGFRECGRIPHAFKSQEGTYRDEIVMVLPFKEE